MMHMDSPARPRQLSSRIGNDELVEGLMLVRASTLKMIRLQLAMERNDRRVAVETVDDLLALDRRLRNYLAGVPAADEQLLFRRALEADRERLNHEKLTLAAEVLRRPPEPHVEEAEAADDWLGPRDLPAEEAVPRRSRWWLAGIPVAASGVAAAMWFAGVPEVQSWLVAAMDVVK
jgi:hypothetical protein